MYLKFSVCILIGVLFSCSPKKVWNVNENGAIADGKTLNTETIRKNINACYKEDGGTVLCVNVD
ncbi:hypothetical protein [Ochrovirga pacifica]|uniref:hypothetical protein n=1 Tax=Ochrovirga pacifica TaxID=1042376 RepID=UPI00025583E1|nr:hypothetical protein [Ochrovirga pacifica]